MEVSINMDNNTQKVYKVKDIQKILGIGKNKTYTLCISGEFPHKRIGKTIIIPRKSFEEWLYSQD